MPALSQTSGSNAFNNNLNFQSYVQDICQNNPRINVLDYTREDRDLLNLVSALGSTALEYMEPDEYHGVLNKAYQNFLTSQPTAVTNQPGSPTSSRNLSQIVATVLPGSALEETNAYNLEFELEGEQAILMQAMLLSIQPGVFETAPTTTSENVQTTTPPEATSVGPAIIATPDRLWEPLSGRFADRAEVLMREKINEELGEDAKISRDEVQAVIDLDHAAPNFYVCLQAAFDRLSTQQPLGTALENRIKSCLNNWNASESEKQLINSFFSKLMKGHIS